MADLKFLIGKEKLTSGSNRLPTSGTGAVAAIPGQVYFAKDSNDLNYGRIYFDDEDGKRYMITSLISQYDSGLHEIVSYYVTFPTLTTQYADGIYKFTFSTGSGSTRTYNLTDIYLNGLTWNNGTTAGPTATLTRYKNGVQYDTITTAAIPAASNTTSGIVTTGQQTFVGEKQFNNTVTIGTGSSSGNSLLVSGNANITYKLGFSNTAYVHYDSTDECLYFTFN